MQAGWAAVSVLFVVGCTAISGIEDPEQQAQSAKAATEPRPAPTTQTPPGASTTTSASTTTPAAAADAGADAASAAPTCQPSVSSCKQDSDCDCGNKCNEDEQCAKSCKKKGDGCDPHDAASCCAGSFCSFAVVYPTCQPCLGENAVVPNNIFGQPDSNACCSHNWSMQGGKALCTK